MTLGLVVSKVVQAAYVELNDFDGFRVPGKVVLKTASPVPVSELPGADLNQYGHEYEGGRRGPRQPPEQGMLLPGESAACSVREWLQTIN